MKEKIKRALQAFSITEKIIFYIILSILLLSSLAILDHFNKNFTVTEPVYGGEYTEGVVGYARFINPVLSYTDADKDLTSLVYSGLLKADSNGQLIPDLADSYTVSADGLTYDFKLKSGLKFQDGQPLTTDDIEFTIQKVTDAQINSPKALNWNGVSVSKISDTEIKFTLKKPYTPFIENLTIGILPKHIWSNIQDETFDVSSFNREPIGSGTYKIKSSSRDGSGIYQSYKLESFQDYTGGKPLIKSFVVKFYKNEDDAVNAFNKGDIDGLGGISPSSAIKAKVQNNADGKHVIKTTLPRLFAVFFNQSQAPVLLNKEVRSALNTAINKDSLIRDIFNGYATPANGPVPYNNESKLELGDSQDKSQKINESENIEQAKKILTGRRARRFRES